MISSDWKTRSSFEPAAIIKPLFLISGKQKREGKRSARFSLLSS
jgi:hypothetical protein